jgi:hypothetical protein
MKLKCQGNELNNKCNQQAEWIMITGCDENHIEETPLCNRHLNFYIECHQHRGNSLLLCDTCKREIREYDYCTITRVTKEWFDQYVADHLLDEILKQSIASTTTPPNLASGGVINPTGGGWIGTGRVKHTNPTRPPGF